MPDAPRLARTQSGVDISAQCNWIFFLSLLSIEIESSLLWEELHFTVRQMVKQPVSNGPPISPALIPVSKPRDHDTSRCFGITGSRPEILDMPCVVLLVGSTGEPFVMAHLVHRTTAIRGPHSQPAIGRMNRWAASPRSNTV